jgi:hypothetical protein
MTGKNSHFRINGVRVLNFETGKIRSLITNNTVGLEDLLDWKVYYPTHWSPNGKSIAVGSVIYETGGLISYCLRMMGVRNYWQIRLLQIRISVIISRYFYVASNSRHGIGFAKVDWLIQCIMVDIYSDTECCVDRRSYHRRNTMYFLIDSVLLGQASTIFLITKLFRKLGIFQEEFYGLQMQVC